MPIENEMIEIEARCRLIAAELEREGLMEQHDLMLTVAESIQGGRTATAQAFMMGQPSMDIPYQFQELADVGSDENPRPPEEEILSRTPSPGSRLDPDRGTPKESDLRKWTIQISDIPAADEGELKSMVTPFIDEVGGLLADYKEEAPRTRVSR